MSVEIFKFLERFPKFISDINPELKCTLCHNLIINPCYTPCFCEFCRTCITSYLSKGKTICPGENNECSHKIITIDDIVFNPVTNNKIINLKVKCLKDDCDYEASVKDMVHHWKICEESGLNCPLWNYGCMGKCLQKMELKSHLLDYNGEHLNILKTRFVQIEIDHLHLNNENRQLKEEIERLKVKNKKIKEKYGDLEKRLCLLESTKDEMSMENLGIKVENKEKKKEIGELQQNVLEMQDKLRNLESVTKEVGDFRRESAAKFIGLQKKLSNLDLESKNLKLSYSWNLNGFEGHKGKRESCWSPTFASAEGYKMQVGMWFSGGAGYDIGCRLVKGERDEGLAWPCTKLVRIGIINQETGASHLTFDIRFIGSTASKPAAPVNREQWHGWVRRSLSELTASPSVLQNDQISTITEIV